MTAEVVVKGAAAFAVVALFSAHVVLAFFIVKSVLGHDPFTIATVAGLVFYTACRSLVKCIEKILELKQGENN